jgi:hypothetical protein
MDAFRHKPVWAAYRFRKGFHRADARGSEFSDLAAARAAADALNGNRGAGVGYYFKVCRVAPLQPGGPEPGTLSPDK